MQDSNELDFRAFKNKTALIVEDDFGARELLTHMLRAFNMECITAETGEEAEELMKERSVDIMLLDIALGPGISGLQLCYNLKQDEQHRRTPVVAVTAFSKSKLANLKEMGFNGYLAKPYTRTQLQQTLDNYLSGVGIGI